MIKKDIVKKKEQLKQLDCYHSFPIIIDLLEYLYSGLEKDISLLGIEEQIDNNYEIHEFIISTWMEILRVYLEEILNQSMNYEFDEILSIGGCAAYNDEKNTILLSVIGLMIQEVNLLSYIQPPIHEFRHKLQHDFYKENKIKNILKYPDYFLLIEKHYIYKKHNKDDSFYINNYTHLYPELDAEEYSSTILEQILPALYQKYVKKEGTSKELEERVKLLQEKIKIDAEEIKESLKNRSRIDTSSSKEIYESIEITSSFKEKNQLLDSLVEIDYYLKNHPELQEEYPILTLLWNESHPKSYQEILLDKKNLLEIIPNQEILVLGYPTTTHDQIKKLYKRIISSDPILQIEQWKETNQEEKINGFLKRHPTILERYPQELYPSFKQKRKSRF